MTDSLYIAVDLGAGSGRVFLTGVASDELLLEEIHRFQYPPTHSSGHLRWNIEKICYEINLGLIVASKRAKELGRTIKSIGVDSWGVDYSMIDAGNRVLEDPICYRDERTRDVSEKVFEIISFEKIFERTGIQHLEFNTIFQLFAHKQTGIPEYATQFLMIPDLINHYLSDITVTEYTNATTTQLINVKTGDWDSELIERLGLPMKIAGKIVPAGTDIGPVKLELAQKFNLNGVRVVAPATHDTASAIVGTPLNYDWAYISSGTWSLVGVERTETLINSDVARHNFTNEGGAFGTFRFLKNVMGLWILESCRKEWEQQGYHIDYDSLLAQVGEINEPPGASGIIFPDDSRFFNPKGMLVALAEYLTETGQKVTDEPPVVTKIILDSLAFRYGAILKTIEKLTGEKIPGIHIVGGGSRNDYLNQATSTITGLPVLAGPVEATVIGNMVVQAIAQGRFESLVEARQHVAQNIKLKKFTPNP